MKRSRHKGDSKSAKKLSKRIKIDKTELSDVRYAKKVKRKRREPSTDSAKSSDSETESSSSDASSPSPRVSSLPRAYHKILEWYTRVTGLACVAFYGDGEWEASLAAARPRSFPHNRGYLSRADRTHARAVPPQVRHNSFLSRS